MDSRPGKRSEKNSANVKITPLEIKTESSARKLMMSMGVSKEGVKILAPKTVHSVFRIEGVKSWEANIIKQHLLSLGADAAIERKALVRDITTDILVFGSRRQIKQLCYKLKNQPFSLNDISKTLLLHLENLNKNIFNLTCRKKNLVIKKPVVCGIINVTEDSFSRDGLLCPLNSSQASINQAAYKLAESMIKSGARIIDIGGESTRPFSKPLSEKEEIKKILPVIKFLRKKFKKVIISVDTYKYAVAKVAADAGVDMINDITALRHSPKIAQIIKRYKLGCVLMHMKGVPSTMQISPKYGNLMQDISSFFKQRLDFCRLQGVGLEQICLDPGIGFGKNLIDNYKIIDELYKLKAFGLPLYLGISRKSFIGKLLRENVNDRLIGSIAASSVSLIRGANILRAHDVKETVQAVKITSAINLN